jgi:hypothetical protein
MKDMETDEPGLLRFWFEFDLSGHAPVVEPGQVLLDGGTQTYRLLGQGAGVTGYDGQDCLAMLERVVGHRLPPVTRVLRQPDLSRPPTAAIDPQWIGNPAWRGVWFPPMNRCGPVIG